jgi:hypothetical protein
VYIDHVIYFNRTTTVTNPKEHTVLYVLRAPGPDYSVYYLSGTNTYNISKRALLIGLLDNIRETRVRLLKPCLLSII